MAVIQSNRSKAHRIGAAITAVLLSAAAPAPPAGPLLHGTVSLRARVPIADGMIGRLPVVLPGKTVSPAVAARINAAFRTIDSQGINAAKDCLAQSRESTGRGGNWERIAKVTMAGPRYLAVMISDSYYCGGPYPTDGLRSFYVYDLAVGRPVNWLALIPRDAEVASSGDDARSQLVISRELVRRVAARALPDCKPALEPWRTITFEIGLDGRSGEMIAVPAGFPHAIQACAEEVRLRTSDLRRLNFSPQLISSLAEARRLNAAPPRAG